MGMQCKRCAGERFTKAGRDRSQRQLYRCRACGRRLTARTGSAFSGYRFPDAVIALAVRWYLRFRLSYAEVAEWLAERGVTVDPSTLYDWVQAFTPHFIEAAREVAPLVADRGRAGGVVATDEQPYPLGGVAPQARGPHPGVPLRDQPQDPPVVPCDPIRQIGRAHV